jgi:hypothetical protein
MKWLPKPKTKAATGCDGTKLARAAPTTAWVVSIISGIPAGKALFRPPYTSSFLDCFFQRLPETSVIFGDLGYVMSRIEDINLK